MLRSTPWRNKPTPFILQMIPVAKQLKLYLVNQIGPTSLVFKDQNDNKFKVVIGDHVNCSCNVVKDDHCIHSLFVLLKKFKVSQTHPILWQASYLDSQLDGLTQQKYQQSIKPKTKVSAKQFLKRKKQVIKQDNGEDFPPLDQDQMCPICYQQMTGQCYSTCDTCHKSLHTKCFKVWTKHKQDNKSPVTCPMCRTQFKNPTVIIYKDLQKWQQRFSTHKGTCCKGCGQKNIKGSIYKCLICPNTDLCKLCYQDNQHFQHQIFFCKQLVHDKWKVAPIRARKTRKLLFQPIQQASSIKQILSIEHPSFILKLLPTIKQHNSKQVKTQFGIIGNQMFTKNMCTKCHTPGTQEMIRLTCSHPIHQECLLSMVQNKQYVCENDGQIICPGYWTALGIKVVKPMKNKNVDLKFIKNNQEKQLLQRKNAINITAQQSNHKNSQIKKQTRNISLGNHKQSLGITTKQTFGSLGGVNRISGIKMKETKPMNRPPTIPKKSNIQRRQQIQSLSIGGFGVGLSMNNNQLGIVGNFGGLIGQQAFSSKKIGNKGQIIRGVQKGGPFSNKNIVHMQR